MTHFEREMMLHLDGLYAFALTLARLPDDAEDLVSDTIERALERQEERTLASTPRAWLFTILYQCFIDRWRIETRDLLLSENDDESLEVVGDVDLEGNFYDSIVDGEVTRAIDSLPAHYRQAVVLSEVHAFRYGEIAEILGVPEATVKSRLFRGRRMLQRTLIRYAIDMGYVKPQAA